MNHHADGDDRAASRTVHSAPFLFFVLLVAAVAFTSAAVFSALSGDGARALYYAAIAALAIASVAGMVLIDIRAARHRRSNET